MAIEDQFKKINALQNKFLSWKLILEMEPGLSGKSKS